MVYRVGLWLRCRPIAPTNACNFRHFLFGCFMASSVLTAVSTMRHMTSTTCVNISSAASCADGVKQARNISNGRGQPGRASGSGVANTRRWSQIWMKRCLKNLSGNQASLQGCERQAILQGHVVPLGDPELKRRHGDTVEAVMPVRLGNATLWK